MANMISRAMYVLIAVHFYGKLYGKRQVRNMAIQEKKKLTLRLDKQVIEGARHYADRHNISISALVEAFLHNLTEKREEAEETKHTPLVHQLTGILPAAVDIEQEYGDYLMRKYGG